MRVDKYLKTSRLIKRRTVAKELLDKKYISVNDQLAKPATEVKVGDVITIVIPEKVSIKARVLLIKDFASVADSSLMYEII